MDTKIRNGKGIDIYQVCAWPQVWYAFQLNSRINSRSSCSIPIIEWVNWAPESLLEQGLDSTVCCPTVESGVHAGGACSECFNAHWEWLRSSHNIGEWRSLSWATENMQFQSPGDEPTLRFICFNIFTYVRNWSICFLCTCVGTHVKWHTCRSQRTIFESQFSPSAMWTQGWNSGRQAWQQAPSPTESSHQAPPSV